MSEEMYYCPLCGDHCIKVQCMFWDDKTDVTLCPQGRCVLVRAAYAISTHER